MKTANTWMDEWFPANDSPSWPIVFTKSHIECIQKDARKELELEIRRLNHNIEVYKKRWHQARRYLRAANKGAERNNIVMRLQAADICRFLDRIKQLEQTNQ